MNKRLLSIYLLPNHQVFRLCKPLGLDGVKQLLSVRDERMGNDPQAEVVMRAGLTPSWNVNIN